MDISEIIWQITMPNSTAMDNKVISSPYTDIKLNEHLKETVQILKNKEIELKTINDAVITFWDYSAYFFLCHIYTELQLNDLSKERNWLKTKLCKLFIILKNNNIPLKNDWIYWQYAQAPCKEPPKTPKEARLEYHKIFDAEELKQREQRHNEWIALAKAAVKKFDPDADYDQKDCCSEFAKETPCEKSDWLDGHLKALKVFIENGECDDKHFTYALYLLLQQRDLGLPRPATHNSLKREYDAVVTLASFAAHVDNKEELFSNVNNYLTDYFYWFLRMEQPGRTDLDTWGGVSGHISHSCGHMNYEGDFYTTIRKNDELNSWIQLMGFFDLISLNEAYLIQRCFGYLFAPRNSTDSAHFAGFFKKSIHQNLSGLKSKPGFAFCLYWMIHFMNEHDFNEVFLEEEKTMDSTDTYCIKNGIIPVKERHYEQNSLEILQTLLFFVLFDLSSKFETGYYEKKFALAPLMETIKNGTWHNKEVLIDIYNRLGQEINLNTELAQMPSDFAHNDKAIKSMVLLVYNLSKFLRQDTRWLINEVSYIKELQGEHLRIPEHIKLREDQKNEELSDTKETKISRNQDVLGKIDSGFRILSFMQKIPSFQNLVLSRELTVKIFIDSDVNTLCSDNKFFRNQYRSLTQAKYAYFDRNMATHYAAFSKVEDLFDTRNFPDLLTALYDLTHNELNLQWLALREERFEKIAAYPYYRKFLATCLDEMEKFVIKETCRKDPVFNDEGTLNPDREELKKLGKKFWASSSIQKEKLKDCLNILYCNSDLMKWHPEYTKENNEIVEECHAEYSTDFWNAYKYEMAVYLIKVAVELTALYK